MRQKTQVELNLGTGTRGEAPNTAAQEVEASAAGASLERPAVAGPSMEAVVERENLKKALAQVKRNKGTAGVDGMTVDELPAYLKEHWLTIRAQLLDGTYKPQPVRRVEIPKASGGLRPLGIPTVLDRFIQQAVMQVLQADWDGTFSEASFGFRPTRSAHQAVERAQTYIASGHAVVVDIDLEKFFDRVNHDILMGLVAKRVADKRLLKLIRGFLTAGVMEGGLVSPTEEGTPQGGPLSPLLSNLMLDVLDKELEKRGHRFVRYADDCNVYVRSQKAGERVMAGIEKFLAKRLKLKVNKAKSAVAKPSVRKFLGFSFTWEQPPRRRIAPQAVARFKAKVRELTRRTGGRSLAQSVKELSVYLKGWRGYFGFCQTPSVLRALDEWIRRRLRAVVWKQWKRGPARFAELRRRGVGRVLAAKTASSPRGPWRLANSPALNMALPIALFGSLGLVSIAAQRTA
ncbi:group II intron reverse transcriptase/maturase [Bradyrhizobium sp. 191]|uniref:group II intron reverse transcriptase/maturase n=1 Tax=Bradyrhizobium sp. 191 TaxID=2782659 RepID=UPI001FFF64C0|nr:group II intron reverse transcriptase/maturase [Bradyrhizobium sp. 191]UPJ62551.1 group II intron reverse transcriptase/maturase [Bradyrhizobium sp. 191]UPJ62729.1 group II intron reverse transcriptase/maturase [Bradyrhizobium sp. 191]UPJ65033.1 group II intron reverse transcriptase/maturase [Bradyrhizobium sp. 191]UPJ68468.1 group II intron reverse transcriptase/maturase [Bradyrhizobium sp. 191]UPJ69158.1 group II intron reverse transcriptase/maturase [Bradyrhizobium sp. 191]